MLFFAESHWRGRVALVNVHDSEVGSEAVAPHAPCRRPLGADKRYRHWLRSWQGCWYSVGCRRVAARCTSESGVTGLRAAGAKPSGATL